MEEINKLCGEIDAELKGDDRYGAGMIDMIYLDTPTLEGRKKD